MQMMKLSAGPRADHQPRPALWQVALPLLAVLSLALALLHGPGPAAAVTLEEAVVEARAATAALSGRIDALPRQAQMEIGTDIRFLTGAIDAGLRELEQLPVPPVHPSLGQELMFLADLVRVVAAEVEEIRGRASDGQKAQIRGLAVAATGSLERVAAVTASWTELTRATAVEVEPTGDGTTIRMIDRTIYDAVRLGGLALLLLGLLACGLRLLALSEIEISIRDLVRQSPVASLSGIAAIVLFLAASLTITLRPATVARLAERVDVAAAPDACRMLAVQRDQLIASQTIDHAGLRDAIKDRMRPVAQDCLELDSQVAAVEAIGWLTASLEPVSPSPAGAASTPSASSEAMDREIERLIGTVQSLRAASEGIRDVAGLDSATALGGGGAGGPVEEIAAREIVAEDETPRVRQVVTTDRVNFRAGPGTDQQRLGTLAEGTEAVLLREDGGWSNIQLEDGRAVFVASDYIEAATRSP